MAYRNGTYVAFHANGTDVPTDSDIKYYNLLKAWTEKTDDDFTMINSHEKAGVRDSSSKTRLAEVLKERLRNSKNMVLIVGETTRFDNDWVPMEIAFAVDVCEIPIIAAYPAYKNIPCPPNQEMEALWPQALRDRIQNGSAKVIHVPFRQAPLKDAIGQFSHEKLPNSGRGYYGIETYKSWGLE